ncbi:MAG TPA: bifunctional UDP-N-acetylglucosamine diphosphorylase/glucosamine-1-phosphate N-acetyltransferase GlmU [Bacillota bacterium]|jgi:bifunctional UDP-N-acetylglucosamine pyrophosphorylase/glucosamine-1-phosphate N-acetyltransferase|nr:bifunctional UDP-N-acetylglucosamine diphosphorylase/glucosamine-1-phosphate N-acetyltransferase GlmU [Bacillota bacterium]HOA34910.1 bifunctional UDP-N-acetylglucosamine diphosphorylase/glucosamine-1-phosphate N-acetyltransferase GlmU [Bacillota bacterium]HOJ83740.1 bifunctional UDP-N-acetylglucosamine diphosphorylase/glucosamine-1-phosphate N-acetyltransferase GlmU [Bacillota bacterium]HOL14620.1 bifunctional UDP-N-acetylglucosamine diphosphorylase/glucosamine-1-phosphate N-acetyltransferas
MLETWAVVLAAGEGKRMVSSLPKVLHPLCGRPMLRYVVDAAAAVTGGKVIIVIGRGAQLVREEMGARWRYALQEEQLGTGHALMQALPQLPAEGLLLVLCGDAPLIEKEHLEQLIREHGRSAATVLTTGLADPAGYGRIIRHSGDSGARIRIVEESDASADEKKISEVNSGIYCFDIKYLRRYLPALTPDNAQREYYLTDLVALLQEQGHRVSACRIEDWRVVLGINDRCQLAEAAAIMRERINRSLMRQGVTMVDPSSTYIDFDVQIGPDTVIWPQTVIQGRTVIGSACRIGPGAQIINAEIHDRVIFRQSVVEESVIENEALVGPFAYIRPGSRIGPGVKIGDFVEVKNSRIDAGTKVPHLSYVGDVDIGGGANLGAGVIVVNFDGRRKHRSSIGRGAFIGCNSNLISPLEIGEGAFIAAGTTVTRNVPPGALAIARTDQENCPGAADRLLKKSQPQKEKAEEEKN